jgi:undecaprenyl-diphosphatase
MLRLHEAAVICFNLALVALFARLSYVVSGNRDPQFDQQVMMLVRNYSAPWLDVVMRVITHAGDPVVHLTVSLFLAFFFMKYYQRRREGVTILIALASGYALSTIFKYHFQRTRPDLWEMVARPQSYSFPSGHAMVSTIIYGSAAFLLEAVFPHYRWYFRVISAVLVCLIGVSRIYLGVHWPSDVLAGFAAGMVIVFATAYWYSRKKSEEVTRTED